MIVQCESCQTEFNLDETLLKKEGTKVRCSQCRHVFKAYPSAAELPKEVDEMPQVTEDVEPVAEEKAVEPAIEGDPAHEESEEGRIAAELESDLDLIYQDVFSGDDSEALDEKTEPEAVVDELFEKATRGEEEMVESPPPVFPAMDTVETDEKAAKKEKPPEKRADKPPKKRAKKAPKKKPEKKSAPAKRKASKSSTNVLIPILFIVLAIAAAYYVWSQNLIPQSVMSLFNASSKTDQPVDSGARLLQFGSVNGAFVNTENSGPLFVIRGMVTNKYPNARRYIKIKGSILNNKGVVVLSKTVYAGNTFSEDELKTLPMDEIMKAADNRDGMAKQNLNVASSATIPFMVVFAELPKDLSEFTVEAVSSLPGS
jgi:predicted Zn finger-like uncharacterized protein